MNVDHLRTYHEMSDNNAKKISRENRAVRVGVSQKQKPVSCPVPGYKSVICRVDKHLRQVDAEMIYTSVSQRQTGESKNCFTRLVKSTTIWTIILDPLNS